jgi:hypothetical protein
MKHYHPFLYTLMLSMFLASSQAVLADDDEDDDSDNNRQESSSSNNGPSHGGDRRDDDRHGDDRRDDDRRDGRGDSRRNDRNGELGGGVINGVGTITTPPAIPGHGAGLRNTSNDGAPSVAGTSLSGLNSEQDRVRRDVRSGRIRKLSDVLATAATRNPGDIISVKLKTASNRDFYEIKVLTEGNRVVKLKIDAQTLSIY